MLASRQLFIWRTQSAQLVTCCKIVTKLHSRLFTFWKCCLHTAPPTRGHQECAVLWSLPPSLLSLWGGWRGGRKYKSPCESCLHKQLSKSACRYCHAAMPCHVVTNHILYHTAYKIKAVSSRLHFWNRLKIKNRNGWSDRHQGRHNKSTVNKHWKNWIGEAIKWC